jgi:3-dehydroquinate synthase
MDTDRRNLIITGFMGTGKSVVAREVARALDRELVDMDKAIVERAGKSIPEIFRQEGEGQFRVLERQLCQELSEGQGHVVATGGGALVDKMNRELMIGSGTAICLDCSPAELYRRLEGDEGRPMLWDDDPQERLRVLLHERSRAYSEIPHHIDTTHKPVEQVVEEALAIYRAQPQMWRVHSPRGDYQVQVHPGALHHVGALLRTREITPRVVVVSDENVWPLHGQTLMEGLKASDYTATSVVLPAGEEHKRLDTVRTLYDRFVEAGVDRSGAIIALGGGVITDMAGFAAATYMRGVPFVPLPTTLLGMVDASVGGKVAVDLPQGKNLVGAFIAPLLVLLDTNVLDTLPEMEQRAGLAEIIKAGIIDDPELFRRLESEPELPEMRWLVGRALRVKIDVVEEDPYEQGRRAVLNLGHTFAHAIEVLEGYGLHHGLAVSIGMVAAAHLAELRDLCSAETLARITATLRNHGLPTQYDAHPPEAIYEAMQRDKKKRAGRLRLILPRAIGDVIIDSGVSKSEIVAALERIRS